MTTATAEPEAPEAPTIPTTTIEVPGLGTIGEPELERLKAPELRTVLGELGLRPPASARKPDLKTWAVNMLRLRAMAELEAPVVAVEPRVDLGPAELEAVRPGSGDVIMPPTKWQQLLAQAEYVARANLCPAALRGKPNDVGTIFLMSYDLGITFSMGLQSLYVIDGKVGMEGELMLALTRRDGHSVSIERSDREAAIVRGVRADNGDVGVVEFSIEDAADAGLVEWKEQSKKYVAASGKRPWDQYRSDMLLWRAVSRLCRRMFPDCLQGLSYTPDELGYLEAEPVDGPKAGRAGEDEPTVTLHAQQRLIAERIDELDDDLKAELRAEWMGKRLPKPELLTPAAIRTATAMLEVVEAKQTARHDTSHLEEAELVPDGTETEGEGGGELRSPGDTDPAGAGPDAPGGPAPSPEGEPYEPVDGPGEADERLTCVGCHEPIPADEPPVWGDDDQPYHQGCSPFGGGS